MEDAYAMRHDLELFTASSHLAIDNFRAIYCFTKFISSYFLYHRILLNDEPK
jgi:hypothetical protein